MATQKVRKPKISKPKIRKGDTVQVIAGREKGKTGKVLSVDAKNARVLVEGVNKVKRHVRPSQANPQGGIEEKELSLHYSNVLLFNQAKDKGMRVGFKVEKGQKTRVFKSTGEAVSTGK